MKIFPMIFGALTMLSMHNAASAQQGYEINIHKEVPIHFSNNITPDLLTVDAVGFKTFNVVLLITIRRAAEDRYPLFAAAVIAKQATPIHWQDFSIDNLNELISKILFNSNEQSVDLPSWEDLKKSGLFCESAEICPQVDNDVYERVRSSGRPLFCYLEHYETITCAWFDDQWGTGRIVTQIGW